MPSPEWFVSSPGIPFPCCRILGDMSALTFHTRFALHTDTQGQYDPFYLIGLVLPTMNQEPARETVLQMITRAFDPRDVTLSFLVGA